MIALLTWFHNGNRKSHLHDDLEDEVEAKVWAQRVCTELGVYAQLSWDGRFYLMIPDGSDPVRIVAYTDSVLVFSVPLTGPSTPRARRGRIGRDRPWSGPDDHEQ